MPMNYRIERPCATALVLLLLKSYSLIEPVGAQDINAAEYEEKVGDLERRYCYGAPQPQQPQQYNYQYYNGYYYPYYYQQNAGQYQQYGQQQYRPQPQYMQRGCQQQPQSFQFQHQPQQKNRNQETCSSDGGSNIMSLLSKMSNTKHHVDGLTSKVENLVSDIVRRPIQGFIEIPQTVYDGFSAAISVSRDLQGAAHYARCAAAPAVRKALIEGVKTLEGSKQSPLSVSLQTNSGPLSGIKSMVSEVEGLVSQAVRDIVLYVANHASQSNSGSDDGSSSDDNQSSPSSDPYAGFSDDGSDSSTPTSSASADNPYAAFSDYADPTTTSTTQKSTAAAAQCGKATFTTAATFKFTVTKSGNHASPTKVYTFTTQKTYTFSNLAKRAAEYFPDEMNSVRILDGIDSGDGDPEDNGYGDNSNTGLYSYAGNGYDGGDENTGFQPEYMTGTGGGYEPAYMTATQGPKKHASSSSTAAIGTGPIYPHASISFIQHATNSFTSAAKATSD